MEKQREAILMKKIALFLTVMFVLVLSCNIAFAGAQDFTLINNAKYNIFKVYVSPSAVDDWQEDILGDEVLMKGEQVNITFDRGETATLWDLRVVDENEKTHTWKNINLKKISTVTLNPTGTATWK